MERNKLIFISVHQALHKVNIISNYTIKVKHKKGYESI
jgi:hypothetical protein